MVSAARCLALGLALVLSAACARAQVAPPAIDLTSEEAQGLVARWIAEGAWDKAASLMSILEQADPDNPQVIFLAAQVSLGRGEYRGAIERLRKLLVRDPTLTRVRLDLARALFMDRQYEAARYHFELALGQRDLPDAVRDNVNAYLRAIAAQTTWVAVTATIGPDSNPNNATRFEVVNILGTPFIVDRSAREQQGIGLNLVANARRAFGPDSKAFVRGYLEYRDFPDHYADFAYLQGTGGYNFVVGDSVWTAEAGPLGAVYQHRHLYSGGTVQLSHASPIAPRWLGTQFVTYRSLSYTDYEYLSGDQFAGGGSLRYAIDARSATWVTLTLARSDAEDPAYSYRSSSALVGYTRELPLRVNVEIRVSATRYRYDAPQPLFGETRADGLWQVEVDLTARDYSWSGFAPRVTFGWADNTSSIDLYSYRRVYGGVGVTRAF